jgi:DNA repair exonuclease SbcCD ATPase subunit
MSVVLKRLSFSNMFSYGQDNVLELNNTPITQLLAGNGSGKSSLAIIIQELLYNKNIKGLKKSDILNRYSKAKTWEGKIEFSVDGIDYEVISKRSGASTHVTLLKDGKDISEHKVLDTYKKIADIIGRDFETFSQLTYQSSTDSLEFLKATDTNRKKFLVNLFNFSRYLEIGDDLKAVQSAKEKELALKQGELRTVVDFITKNVIPEKAVERVVPEVDTSLYARVEELKVKISQERSICDKIDRNNLNIEERDKLSFDLSMKEPELDQALLVSIEDIKSSISKHEAEISSATRSLKSLDTSDHCYACKQPIDNSQSIAIGSSLREKINFNSTAIATKKTELANLNSKLAEYSQAKSKYDKNQKAIDKFTQLSQLIDSSLPTSYPDYKFIQSQLTSLEKELAWQEKENTDARKHNDSVKIRNAKIDALVEQLRDFKARQELLNDDILKLQNEVANIAILRKAFSTSGIVAYKLENVAKQLEDNINHYLALLSDGQFQVIFRLAGDKLNVIVVNNGEEVSIDSLSGGEFSRVQTSVLLAVRGTLSNIGGKSINLLFLDEIMAVLDDSGKESLIDVLVQERDLNVFLISHEYSHPLIPKLHIQKIDGISNISSLPN